MRFERSAGFALLVILAAVGGCSDLNYRRIRLGQSPQDYERIMPAEKSRRTDTVLCSLETDMAGRTDAIVILLARDRRVCARIHATYFQRNYGFKTDTGYQLTGELDPAGADLKATGPADSLRVISADLTAFRGDKLATDAQRWVAAGLTRILQRWPNAGQPTGDPPELAEFLGKVAGGGRAQITTDERGVFRFEYVQGVAR